MNQQPQQTMDLEINFQEVIKELANENAQLRADLALARGQIRALANKLLAPVEPPQK